MTSPSTTPFPNPVLPLKPRTRVTWSAQDRQAWVILHEQSGQTASEFCRENDLSEATLSLWRRQLREGEESVGEEAPLVEVPLSRLSAAGAPETEKLAAGTALTIRLPGGMHLEVVVGTDAAWLAGIVRALRSSGV